MKTGLIATVTTGVLLLGAPLAGAEVVYLMSPPWVAADKVDPAAPLSRWAIIGTYDSAEACAAEQLKLVNIADAESDEAVRWLAIRMAFKDLEKLKGAPADIKKKALDDSVSFWTERIRAMHPGLKGTRPALLAASCVGSGDPRLATPR